MRFLFPLLLIAAVAGPAFGQTATVLDGRLVNSLNGDPLAGATVVIDEPKREVVSGQDGTFHFDNLAPGTYHVWVRAQGYSSRRTEITVPIPGGAPVELRVDFDLHFQEVASVSAETRSQFDAFQPTTVLSGQELTKQLESSLGATLDNQPGIASRSFGSAPSRPVIRGLDGDRVQILQDGQRTGDLSSQSGDHGVSVNPAAAERIEVVRGPATLLYGANAIGGLVNIITNDVPTRPVQGASGEVTFDAGTSAEEAGGAGNVQLGNGKFAASIGGGGRRSDDYSTPLGKVIELAFAQRLHKRRRGMDRRQGSRRGELRLRRHEVRHSGRRRRDAAADAAPPRAHDSGRGRTAYGRLRGVSRHGCPAQVHARRARGDGDRHELQQRHDRAAAHGLASRLRPDEGQRRRMGARSRVRRGRRRSTFAGCGSERVWRPLHTRRSPGLT